MLLITGAAGFIGSNLVADLNSASRSDIVVSDWLGSDDYKWRNLGKRQLAEVVPPPDLLRWLDARKLDGIVHLGAISDTTATDADHVMETNFRLSLRLLDWCTQTRTPFIYASSAATYGDGALGFSDDWSLAALRRFKPMNLYGWSKHLFDLAVADRFAKHEKMPPHWVGLKFFNVFGPNEYHKGAQGSVLSRVFYDAKVSKPVRLYKSHREGIEHGEQKRDFIYIDDAIAVMRWIMAMPSLSGIFNVGTGKARSFRDMILAMFAALGQPPNIEYIDMPASFRNQYQYFTQAEIQNLRRAGYNANFMSLEEGVTRYVTGYLDTADRYR